MLSLLALIAAGLFVIWFVLRKRPKTTPTKLKTRPVTHVKPTLHAISDDEATDGTKCSLLFSSIMKQHYLSSFAAIHAVSVGLVTSQEVTNN